ncbi:MAG: hypothetical protein P8Y97_21120 [Candidatus Lokiarchaeota archaeon]
MKIKTKSIIFLLWVTLAMFFNAQIFVTPSVEESEEIDLLGLDYSWGERTIEFDRIINWNNETYLNNDTRVSYEDWIDYDSYYDNESNYIEERTYVKGIHMLSQFYNFTILGNKTTHYKMDGYYVDINLKNVSKVHWFALKNLTSVTIINFPIYKGYVLFKSNDTYIKTKVVKKYTDNSENRILLDSWSTTWNETTIYNDQYDRDWGNSNGNITEMCATTLILINREFITPTNDTIMWSQMFNDLLLYNDENSDNIYTIQSNPQNSLEQGIESRGTLYGCVNEWRLEEAGDHPYFQTYPLDRKVSDFLNNIEFTPPKQKGQYGLEWNVFYKNFPLKGMVYGDSDTYAGDGRYYDETYLSDFNYTFTYTCMENQSKLDYTMDISRFTDTDIPGGYWLQKVLDGLSLSIPQYTYFLSTANIQEADKRRDSEAKNLFNFVSNGITVAQVDMEDPSKKFYNLTYTDYYGAEHRTVGESHGASVSSFLLENVQQLQDITSLGNDFADTIFSIEDIASKHSKGLNFNRLFTVETNNYPEYSGARLVHDPVLRAYHTPIELPDITTDPPPKGSHPLPNLLPFIIGVPIALSTVFFLFLAYHYRYSLNKKHH